MRPTAKVRLIKLLIHLLGLLPLRANHALGALVGHVIARIPSKTRRTVRVNLELCFPELPEAERERLLKQSLIETAKTATEIAYFWSRPPEQVEKLIREVRAEVFEQAIAQGRGVIVAAPHLGAWELLNLYWGRRLPVNTLYRPPRHAEFEPLLNWARERTGAKLYPATPRGIRGLYKALAKREVAAILPDQTPPDAGVIAPFFGQPAKTMTLLSKLAAQSGAIVVFGFAERLPRGQGYRFHFLPADAAVADPDSQRAATAVNAGVEACVRMVPAQYQWTYRRFRRRQDGSGDPYSGKSL